jgi:hypothetical protein
MEEPIHQLGPGLIFLTFLYLTTTFMVVFSQVIIYHHLALSPRMRQFHPHQLPPDISHQRL